MIDSPAACLRRLLLAFRSEGLSFPAAWNEARRRLHNQSRFWDDLLGGYVAAWLEAWEDDDFEAVSACIVAALERIARAPAVAGAARSTDGVPRLSAEVPAGWVPPRPGPSVP